ncbi:MAG: NUDIX domain-containing protein [Anaerolineales bacterium]|nr:NUDIX domain-containing protein [Anaerolineales bacterium]
MDYLQTIRSKVGSRKIILAYVTALIVNEGGELLWQKRGDFEWWGLPGGVLELGESFSQCCVREVLEETGFHVEPVRAIGLYSGPQFDVRYPNGDEVQQFTLALECRIVGGDGRVDGQEARAQTFFAPSAFPATSPWYAAMARGWQSGQATTFFEPPRFQTLPASNGDYILQLRAAVGQIPLIGVGSNGVIFNEAGQVLLIQRADNGQWNTPGGYSDLGENAAETCVREVYEEIGLHVEPTRLISVRTQADYLVTYPNGDQTQVCVALFACRVVGGALKLDKAEIADAAFFSADALPEPMPARAHQRVTDALLNLPYTLFS